MYNAANAMLQFVKDKISLSISTPPISISQWKSGFEWACLKIFAVFAKGKLVRLNCGRLDVKVKAAMM